MMDSLPAVNFVLSDAPWVPHQHNCVASRIHSLGEGRPKFPNYGPGHGMYMWHTVCQPQFMILILHCILDVHTTLSALLSVLLFSDKLIRLRCLNIQECCYGCDIISVIIDLISCYFEVAQLVSYLLHWEIIFVLIFLA